MIQPRDPAHLARQLDHGEVVWRAFVDAGSALRRCDRFLEADQMLERGLGAFPDDPVLLYEHALAAHNSGRYALAITRWERAASISPDVAMCRCGLAANLRELGQLDRAKSVIDEAARAFSDDLVVVTEAARIADARGEPAESLQLWSRAAAEPDAVPEWLQGQASALIRLGRLDEADAAIKAARARFPDDRGPIAVEGILASVREDWPAALAIWTSYTSRFPDDPMGADQLRHAVAAASPPSPAAPAPPAPRPVSAEPEEATRQLLLSFESLGETDEFGSVQRRFAAEPVGLLRWSSGSLDGLLPALEHRFEGMGDAANTELVTLVDGEFAARDRRWGLAVRTFALAGQVDRDALFVDVCHRIGRLRDKLVADLVAADKTFVYCSEGLDGDRLELLHRKLRAFGPVRLLNVQTAAPTAPTTFQGRAGELLEVAPDRFVGFIEHLGRPDGEGEIAYDDWLSICRKVIALSLR